LEVDLDQIPAGLHTKPVGQLITLVRRSDPEDVLDTLADLVAERLSRDENPVGPKSKHNRSGRPPTDLEITLYSAFVALAVVRGFSTGEAQIAFLQQCCEERGIKPPGRGTLKRKLRELRQRMPSPDPR
jgi:hypothetical protein